MFALAAVALLGCAHRSPKALPPTSPQCLGIGPDGLLAYVACGAAPADPLAGPPEAPNPAIDDPLAIPRFKV